MSTLLMNSIRTQSLEFIHKHPRALDVITKEEAQLIIDYINQNTVQECKIKSKVKSRKAV